jgi:hypothetical protein
MARFAVPVLRFWNRMVRSAIREARFADRKARFPIRIILNAGQICLAPLQPVYSCFNT